jgi:hypothetical protein
MIAEAWGLKEAFRSIYRAEDRHEAERRLESFLAAVERAQLPGLHRLRRRRPALARRTARLLRRADHQRPRRRVINKVKVIKRRAYGLPSFDRFRSAYS